MGRCGSCRKIKERWYSGATERARRECKARRDGTIIEERVVSVIRAPKEHEKRVHKMTECKVRGARRERKARGERGKSRGGRTQSAKERVKARGRRNQIKCVGDRKSARKEKAKCVGEGNAQGRRTQSAWQEREKRVLIKGKREEGEHKTRGESAKREKREDEYRARGEI